MRRVFKRIAISGSLAAVVLGVVGLMFAEVAGTWLTGSGARSTGQADAEFDGVLRARVPLLMAAWGFGLIAAAELLMFAVRGEPGAKPAAAPKSASVNDTAEVLLEELLRQAEAKAAAEKAAAERAAQIDAPDAGGASILTPEVFPAPRTPDAACQPVTKSSPG